jgi:hypothetical protein
LPRLAFRLTLLAAAALSAVWLPAPVQAQGGAAVITLVMPVGARQLGMGEAAAALADDVYGTFWNPAGLAFGPVSNEWEVMLPSARKGAPPRAFTTVATKPRTGFLVRPAVWVGAGDGLAFYDGRRWRTHHEHVLDEGEKIEAVVRHYTGGVGNLDSLAKIVRAYNGVKTKEDEEDLITLKIPYDLLFPGQKVTALALDNTDGLWVGTAIGLFRFDGRAWKVFDREEGFTYVPQTAKAPGDSARPQAAGANESIESGDTLATAGAVTDTVSGTGGANPFRSLSITALTVKGTTLWIGTNDGLYEYRQKTMFRRGQNLLPTQRITSVAVHESVEDVYIGLEGHGVARYRAPRTSAGAARWRVFTAATDGLLDDDVRGVLVDKFGHAYTSHGDGVSHFTLRSWEKIRFKGQQVRGLALDEKNRVWVATSEGAWQFTPAHTTPKGRKIEEKNKDAAAAASSERMGGEWEHFHAGNGLSDKNVVSVQAEGSDVWFLTAAGVERYHNAKTQVAFFYETLLPALNLEDLYHAYMAATFPIEEWGTVGGFVNYVSFGKNLTSGDESQATFNAYELVAGVTYATRLNKNAGLGLNAKFIYSALSRGVTSSGENTDGIAASYAVDAGFLQKNVLGLEGLAFGIMLQNMGPAVFYVDQAQSDPIPFTWKVGLAYNVVNRPNHRLVVAGDLNREAFYREPGSKQAEPFWIGSWKAITTPGGDGNVFHENIRQTVYNTGAEYVYANVVALRGGYLLDITGERREMDIGLGFMLSDILQIDGAFIRSFDNGIRNGQVRYSMILRF